MSLFRNVPRRLRFSIAVILLNFALFVLLRLSFLAFFQGQSSPLAAEPMLKAFYLGTKFDLRLALVIQLPVLLLAWLPGLDIAGSRFGRRLWVFYLTAVGGWLAVLHMADFGHFAYLNSRRKHE